MMEVAAREGATAIAHGSTGKGNDQVRFELGAYWFNPSIKIIAPWREWDFKSRSELIAFAAAKQIPVEATASKPYSIRPQPAAHQLRGGDSGRPRRGAAGGDVPAHGRSAPGARSAA